MTVPSGMFAPGGRTGVAREKTIGLIPIQWLEAHPAVRRWHSNATRNTVTATEAVDNLLILADGYEGLIRYLAITGKADQQGANEGIGWRLFFDGVPYIESLWQVGTNVGVPIVNQQGFFQYLWASDGQGRSWIEPNFWVPNGNTVTMGMINNGGTVDPMGWAAWGMYWPVSLHEEWAARGWRGR